MTYVPAENDHRPCAVTSTPFVSQVIHPTNASAPPTPRPDIHFVSRVPSGLFRPVESMFISDEYRHQAW